MADIVEVEPVGDPERVERLLRRVAPVRGLRVSRSDPPRLRLSASTIGETGPSLEAAAVRSEVRLRLTGLAAFVPSAGLGGRPSPVWPALEDACLRRELAAARGEAIPVTLDGWVRVEVMDGSSSRWMGARGP